MKNKTLALITATIITVAALILTAGLSLLHSSAAVTVEIPDESVVDIDTVSEISLSVSEIEMPESEPDISESDDEKSMSIPIAEKVEHNYPDYEYVEGDARTVYIDGDDVSNGVVIDVYSHKTGKLVGQLAFTSEAISRYISELMNEEFDPVNELWIVESEACVNLPEGDYRIEVYAGTWFAYTYGNGDMFELTQCTLTFAGGEKLNGYIDMLISDLIADIEAGNVEAPDPETAVSKLLYRGIEGYWEGYYVEECDFYVPAAGRFCERFPYID